MSTTTARTEDGTTELTGSEDLPDETPLTEDEVFHLLQCRRRRDSLRYLADNDGGPVEMRELAEQVAAWEHETTVAALTSKQRQRVYIPLYQTHLPKLDEADVVDYDQSRGRVVRGPSARRLERHLDLGAAGWDPMDAGTGRDVEATRGRESRDDAVASGVEGDQRAGTAAGDDENDGSDATADCDDPATGDSADDGAVGHAGPVWNTTTAGAAGVGLVGFGGFALAAPRALATAGLVVGLVLVAAVGLVALARDRAGDRTTGAGRPRSTSRER